MSHRTIAQSIVLDIDCNLPWSGFLLHCLKLEGAYCHARRRCKYGLITPGESEMMHGLATLNSNNFVVYGQK